MSATSYARTRGETRVWSRPLRQRSALICPQCGWSAHLPGLSADIALCVAEKEFGVTRVEMLSHRRLKHLVDARSFAVWALRSLGRPMSYNAIARAMDRDHSSIVHLHCRAIRLMLGDADFRAAYERLSFRFYSLKECRNGRAN